MEQLLNPDELKQIADDVEMEKIKKALASKRKSEEAAAELTDAFKAREISPHAAARINVAVRAAAERGVREVMVLQFHSRYCNDGGRSINNFEPDWPNSLEGFGKTAFEYYKKELRPLGFKLRAEIISFPDGMPGDVGIFLHW